MKYDRILAMEEYIHQKQTISNKELCDKYEISMQTLRRDINTLCRKGSVRKIYGGVVYNESRTASSVASMDQRHDEHAYEKDAIGKDAASLVEENDVIFIDSGTTAACMIPYLNENLHITVITHSLFVINALFAKKNIKAILLGGELNYNTQSFMSDPAEIPYRYNKAFIATVGINEQGCTNTNIQEGRIKRHAMAHSDQKILLADRSKFLVCGYNTFAYPQGFDVIISDADAPEWLQKSSGKYGIEIRKAGN